MRQNKKLGLTSMHRELLQRCRDFALVLVSFGIGSRVSWVSVLEHGVSRNFVVHKIMFCFGDRAVQAANNLSC